MISKIFLCVQVAGTVMAVSNGVKIRPFRESGHNYFRVFSFMLSCVTNGIC